MNGAADLFGAQRCDHALNLPPVAEAQDIAGIAAVLGANRSFEPGIIAISLDEVGSVCERGPSVDERHVHGGER